MLIEHAKSQLLLVDLQQRLVPAMIDPTGLIRRAGILLTAARELAVPVLVTEQYPAGLGPTVTEIAAALRPEEIFAKTEFSAYANPALRQALDQSPPLIVMAGIETHVCMLQTAIELRTAGRAVFLVTDATSARAAENKATALQRLASAGVHLVTTEMVLFEWLRRADRPEFKPVSQLIR